MIDLPRFPLRAGAVLLALALRTCLAQAADPAHVARSLDDGDSPSLAKLVSTYNLRDDETNAACTDFGKASVHPLWSTGSTSVSAVVVDSRSCVAKFLIVFRRERGAWSHAGTVALNERYTQPVYEVLPLLPGGSRAIVVRKQVVDSGAGMSQENTRVFALLDGHLRLVFNQPESIDLAVPYKPACCPVQYVEHQRSSFVTASPDTKGLSRIDETRRIEVNGTTVVQYRSFRWDDRWQTFVSTAFAPAP